MAKLTTPLRPADPKESNYEELKQRIHSKLVDKLDLSRVGELEGDTLRREIRMVVEHLCDTEDTLLNRNERERLVSEVLDETFGLGPLEMLLEGSHDQRYSDQRAEEHLLRAPRQDGEDQRRLPRQQPSDADHRPHHFQGGPAGGRDLPDGRRPHDRRLPFQRHHSAVGAGRGVRVHPPLRRQSLEAGRPAELRAFTPEMVMLLEGAIKARLNILISGGTGSGKTTLLNTLSSFIPNTDRIVTIEDAAELQLQQDHVVRLETRPPNIEGKGAITATDLVKNALRMRPERIIIGECRGAEALDMLQAMNTGHEGSMTTLHANAPRDALARLETMIMMAGFELPLKAMRDADRQRH